VGLNRIVGLCPHTIFVQYARSIYFCSFLFITLFTFGIGIKSHLSLRPTPLAPSHQHAIQYLDTAAAQ